MGLAQRLIAPGEISRTMEFMNIRRSANAVWQGNLQEGSGTLSAPGGVLNQTPYSAKTRFGDAPGTNPEELIAAAHAGCFTMATSFALQNAGFVATKLETRADLTLEQSAAGFAITGIHLTMRASIPGVTAEQFQEIAAGRQGKLPRVESAQLPDHPRRHVGLKQRSTPPRWDAACASPSAADRDSQSAAVGSRRMRVPPAKSPPAVHLRTRTAATTPASLQDSRQESSR